MSCRRVLVTLALATPGLMIVLFFVWFCFYFGGGTPWGRSLAQAKINNLLEQKYPHQAYTVKNRASFDPKLMTYTVSVTFPQYPQDVFVYKLAGSDLKYWMTFPASTVENPQAWNGLSDTPP